MNKNKVELIIEENQLDTKEKASIVNGFDGFESIAKEWQVKAKQIKVTSINDKEQIALAKEGRKFLKAKRIEIEKNRKAMKETALRKGQAIDAVARFLTSLLKPTEEYLYEQEKFAEIQETKRLDELEATRKEKLSKYVEDVELFKVREMEDEAFDKLLASQKRSWEIEQEEVKKVEEERIAREKAEKIRQLRVSKFNTIANNIKTWDLEINVGLDVDSDSFDKDYEVLNKKVATAIKEVKSEKAKLEKEKQKLEAEREKERIVNEKKLEEERQKRLKIEAEQKAKEEEENRKREEEEEKKRVAQTAPDKEKLKALAKQLLDVEYPEVNTEEAKKVLAGVKELMQKVNVYIVTNVDKL